MTTAELLDRVAALGCRVVVSADRARLLGATDRADPELRALLHDSREALTVLVLRREADRLGEFLDGPAPYAARLGRLPEFQAILDRLGAAQERLFLAWRAKGWRVAWDSTREVFALTGAGSPPVGAEDFEIHQLKEVSP